MPQPGDRCRSSPRFCHVRPRAPLTFQAGLQPDSLCFDAPASPPLLQSALQAGITLDSCCRNGTCRTCICLLHSGTVSYRIDWPGLCAPEKQAGFILPCVAYPASDLVLQRATPE